jgi:hypothetical protein
VPRVQVEMGVASKQPALWVPVVTTVAAAVTTHIGAQRYEILIVSYDATARRLSTLRDQWLNAKREAGKPLDAEAFVLKCEQVISSENQGWMAGWLKSSSGGNGSG